MRRLTLCLLILLCMIYPLEHYLAERSQASSLKPWADETEFFREQGFSEEALRLFEAESGGDREAFGGLAAIAFARGQLPGEGKELEKYREYDNSFRKYKSREYQQLQKSCASIWADLECFPVRKARVSYEDSWGEPRSYGGERLHEGTDIFPEEDCSGIYPIVSMTDGVVEQVGWLPLGGYRIGIRGPHGGYFYYAHLSSYDKEFQRGDEVEAGDILGFMGNTGYGAPGTQGKFPVHLHLGIYLATEHYQELSVNPYWMLRSLEESETAVSREMDASLFLIKI